MNHPPFCPRPSCRYHRKNHAVGRWYRCTGTYPTRAFGTVQRFQCTRCGKYFSTQTFSIDYYGKRTLSYQRLFMHLITTSSIRDMARDFSVSVDVVLNKLERFSRNCIAALQRLQRELPLSELLAADGFESFTVSQFFPCHINLLAGRGSQLVYWFDYVTLRRKGRMTDEQRSRRTQLEQRFRADPKGVRRSFRRLYSMLCHLICDGKLRSCELATDEHSAYQLAAAEHRALEALTYQGRCTQIRVSSKRPRTHFNPLFAVNYLDRQIRKDMAEHVRETVCFGRNVNRALDRMVIYLTYHNLKKPFREVKGDFRSHAEVAGMCASEVGSICYGMFTRRAFYSKVKPEGRYKKMWLRQYVTPLKEGGEYLPRHAAA
jgi:hypothetical protein